MRVIIAASEAHPKGQATDKGDDWRKSAACRDQDPELFFPVSKTAEQEAKAKAICKRCPVKMQCFKSASEYGIWGGLNEDERRELRQHHISEPGTCAYCSTLVGLGRLCCSRACLDSYNRHKAREQAREKYPLSRL